MQGHWSRRFHRTAATELLPGRLWTLCCGADRLLLNVIARMATASAGHRTGRSSGRSLTQLVVLLKTEIRWPDAAKSSRSKNLSQATKLQDGTRINCVRSTDTLSVTEISLFLRPLNRHVAVAIQGLFTGNLRLARTERADIEPIPAAPSSRRRRTKCRGMKTSGLPPSSWRCILPDCRNPVGLYVRPEARKTAALAGRNDELTAMGRVKLGLVDGGRWSERGKLPLSGSGPGRRARRPDRRARVVAAATYPVVVTLGSRLRRLRPIRSAHGR